MNNEAPSKFHYKVTVSPAVHKQAVVYALQEIAKVIAEQPADKEYTFQMEVTEV